MCELEKIGKVFTSKFVRTGPSSYKKRIYRAAVSQRLRNTTVYDGVVMLLLISEVRRIHHALCQYISTVHLRLNFLYLLRLINFTLKQQKKKFTLRRQTF